MTDFDYMRRQSPHTTAALTPHDVHPGVEFVTYRVNGPGSALSGRFMSEPYHNGDDDWVVKVLFRSGANKGREIAYELASLGIAVDRYTGAFNDHVTILAGEDEP